MADERASLTGVGDERPAEPRGARLPAELARALEAAIDALPETYRAIVVLREIEGMSVQEAAECLAISEEAARVRLHRARTMLREELWQRAGSALTDVFAIGGERCAAIVTRVQLAMLPAPC